MSGRDTAGAPSLGRDAGSGLEALIEIVGRLRGPGGCPWDQKQTPAGLVRYLLEESRELAVAIERETHREVRDEIGDLCFILVMLARMYEEQGAFTMADCLESACRKMIRRHPHVFAGAEAGDEAALRAQWLRIKAEERQARGS